MRLKIVAVMALAVTVACGAKPPDPKDYVAELAAERETKNQEFMSEDDPVPKSRKAELLPLGYFDIDPEYKVPAALIPTAEDLVIPMTTSTGAPRQMRRAGTLEFSLKGQPMRLTAFSELTDQNLDHLAVMFSDLTSGTETYPGGRYIDLVRNATGIYELDFNRAYHPYCYYNESYECPYPPAENRLKIPIRAGERLKSDVKR